jgi:hypothetical protein
MEGNVLNYKARVVVMVFFQREGPDILETYSPISKYSTLLFIISYCTTNNIEITHTYVKTAFLNSPLDESVWCMAPPGYPSQQGYAWKLEKNLFGLKQAPRALNNLLTSTLLSYGFHQSTTDHCLF